jgi:hypothetical protein
MEQMDYSTFGEKTAMPIENELSMRQPEDLHAASMCPHGKHQLHCR